MHAGESSVASRNYTDLIAWQKSMDLVESAYELAKEFPQEEIFGLTSQLRRAVVSIPSNLAEGQGRNSPGDFRRFLSIAHGSLREVETHVYIASRVGYLDETRKQVILSQCAEVGRLIMGLLNSLAEKHERSP
jgi:four helix bundle protein